MERKKISLREIGFKKLALLFCAGLALVLLSVSELFPKEETKDSGLNKDVEKENIQESVTKEILSSGTQEEKTAYYESKLKAILKKVKGIGEVEVMVTLKNSGESVVLKDKPYEQETLNEADSNGGSRISSKVLNEESTVMIKDEKGNTIPYVMKELEAQVEGVLVLAEGAKQATVAADVTAAIEVLFGVPAHKVKVLELGTE